MIFNISSGGGSATGGNIAKVTATAADTLQGKKGVDNLGNLFEGTISNKGSVNVVLFASKSSCDLEKGYYEGGKISISPETKTVSPTNEDQIITPTQGKVLTEVIVKAGGEKSVSGNLSYSGNVATISGLEGLSVIKHIYINAFTKSPSGNEIIAAASSSELDLGIEGTATITALVGDESVYGESEIFTSEVSCSFDGTTLILTAPTSETFITGTYIIVGRS